MSTDKKEFSFVTLFITRKCNLRCTYCNLPSIDTKDISGDEWCQIIDRLAPHTDFFNVLGGEPTLHPRIYQIIEHLNEINANYSMTTNSMSAFDVYKRLVDISKIKSLCVSIDKTNLTNIKRPEDQKSLCGIGLLKKFVKNHGETELIISTVASNYKDLQDVYTLAKEMGVKLAVALQQFSTDERQLNSNSIKNVPPSIQEVKTILRWLVRVSSYDETILDPENYYVAMLDRFLNNKGLWKCSMGLTPAVDSNGDLWPCFDYMGYERKEFSINLILDDIPIDQLKRSIIHECSKCPGCYWNCPFVSELIHSNVINMKFS